jgi:pimeloyl-ACP methyl ester carboxylesterase
VLPEDFPLAAMDRVWAELQDDLAKLTPDARHVTATESGHYIQLQQPELVIDAVREVVEAVRNPASWATPTALATPTA